MEYKFDVERNDFYQYDKPKDRTRNRLTQIAEMGLEEVGYGQFGIYCVVSGLYIERIWENDENTWNDYINWLVSVIEKNQIKTGIKPIDEILGEGISISELYKI